MTAFPGYIQIFINFNTPGFQVFHLNWIYCTKGEFATKLRNLQSRGFSFKGTSMQLIFPHSQNVSRHFLQKLPLPKSIFLKVIAIKSPTHIKVRLTEILWVLSCSPCNVSHSQAQAGVGPPQTLCRSSEEGKLNAHASL